MSSIRPLALARLNASHAQALRTLGASIEGLPVEGLASSLGARVRMSPIAARDLQQIDSTGYLRLSMEWAGGRLSLDVTPDSAGAWVRAVLGADLHASLPPEWTEVALAHAIERISAMLEPLGRGAVNLLGITPIGAGESLLAGFHALWFEAALDDERLQGLLQLDSMSLLIVASLMPAVTNARGPLAHSSLPISMLLSLGHTDLDLAQLRELQPQGMVMIAQPYGTEPQGLLFRTRPGPGQAWSVAARLDGEQLIFLEQPHPMATDAPPDRDPDTEVEGLDRLPIRLSFDLGERVVTLAELQALDSGSALPLDRPLQDFVTIRANGAVVGEGQLVDMDGQLGVMVSRLSISRLER